MGSAGAHLLLSIIHRCSAPQHQRRCAHRLQARFQLIEAQRVLWVGFYSDGTDPAPAVATEDVAEDLDGEGARVAALFIELPNLHADCQAAP